MHARTFDELVIPMAAESPSAVVLDWYSRLERTTEEYTILTIGRPARGARAEAAVARDALFAGSLAPEMAQLRAVRNRVAHEGPVLASSDAVAFARRCLAVIGAFGIAIDAHAA